MSLGPFLLGQTRSTVLGTLYARPALSLHVRELARATGASPGSLHRDLRAMADAGLLLRQEVGRQVHYQANRDCPVFEELASLLRKTSGLADVISAALAPLADSIEMAFVYGSIARGEEHAQSDVDLMVVGRVDFGDIAIALADAQKRLRREINPTVFTRTQFRARLKQDGSFVQQVWGGKKLWLVGHD